MAVTLRQLSEETVRDVFWLTISEDEMHLVQLESIPDRLDKIMEDSQIVARMIYNDETAVGYADYTVVETEKYCQILFFLVDQKHRKRGYGETGLRLLIGELSGISACEKIVVSYMSFNDTGAIELYEKVGFIEEFAGDEQGARFATLSCRKA